MTRLRKRLAQSKRGIRLFEVDGGGIKYRPAWSSVVASKGGYKTEKLSRCTAANWPCGGPLMSQRVAIKGSTRKLGDLTIHCRERKGQQLNGPREPRNQWERDSQVRGLQ